MSAGDELPTLCALLWRAELEPHTTPSPSFARAPSSRPPRAVGQGRGPGLLARCHELRAQARREGAAAWRPDRVTLVPKKRKALKLRISSEIDVDNVLNEPMGKDASLRCRFLMDNARGADANELDVWRAAPGRVHGGAGRGRDTSSFATSRTAPGRVHGWAGRGRDTRRTSDVRAGSSEQDG